MIRIFSITRIIMYALYNIIFVSLQKEVRGSLGTILQIMASIGILIMLCSGPFMEYLSLNIMVLCFSIVTLIPLFFLPESPYFLYSKGKKYQYRYCLLKVAFQSFVLSLSKRPSKSCNYYIISRNKG